MFIHIMNNYSNNVDYIVVLLEKGTTHYDHRTDRVNLRREQTHTRRQLGRAQNVAGRIC